MNLTKAEIKEKLRDLEERGNKPDALFTGVLDIEDHSRQIILDLAEAGFDSESDIYERILEISDKWMQLTKDHFIRK